eukprot:scaffold258581_cov59-Attheya_sp.AAC.2
MACFVASAGSLKEERYFMDGIDKNCVNKSRATVEKTSMMGDTLLQSKGPLVGDPVPPLPGP